MKKTVTFSNINKVVVKNRPKDFVVITIEMYLKDIKKSITQCKIALAI